MDHITIISESKYKSVKYVSVTLYFEKIIQISTHGKPTLISVRFLNIILMHINVSIYKNNRYRICVIFASYYSFSIYTFCCFLMIIDCDISILFS